MKRALLVLITACALTSTVVAPLAAQNRSQNDQVKNGRDDRDGRNGRNDDQDWERDHPRQGPPGPPGHPGPAGPRGATGATGAAGKIGPVGPAGPAGAVGPQGPAGVAGPAGPTGATGAIGAVGPTGPIGPAGPTGATGATGPGATVAEVPTSGSCGPGRAGANITDGSGNSVVVCDGVAGPTGATGATGPGVAGQLGVTVTGTPIGLVLNPTAFTPLLTATFNVTSANSSVLVTTDGEFVSKATASSEVLIDFQLAIDGVVQTYRRYFQRKDNSGLGGNIRGDWTFSTLVNGLSPGFSHNVTLYATVTGTVGTFPTAPAASVSVCESLAGPGCRLNLIVINK